MNRGWLRVALLAAFMLATVTGLAVVRGHERTLAEGRIVLLELAPVDPRSLMQGDYMALAFAIDAELVQVERDPEEPWPRYAYLRLDEAGRATLAGLGDSLPDLPELTAIRIRAPRHGPPTVASNAFFFQEGSGERYADARWGELRVAPGGQALLTHLRDEELERLGENPR